MEEHYYVEHTMEDNKLVHGGMCCVVCFKARSAHPKPPGLVREEEKVTRRMSLLSLKAELETIEAKVRVCYLEVVEMLVEEDNEGVGE